MENNNQNTNLIKVSTGLERANKQIAITNKLLAGIDNKKDFIEMVFVEGGTFMMGDDDSEYDGEKPAHPVTLSSYYIGKYPVTQAQWKAIMGYNPSDFKNTDSCPEERVTWEDAQLFINKLNKKCTNKKYRLPTEAEWEYAARGGKKSKGYKYSGSDDNESVAWCHQKSDGKTHPVGQKQPNELGIYDMSGNVWEWCNDWYGGYSSEEQTNPSGPAFGEFRVIRGGSWRNNPANSHVAFRINDNRYPRLNIIGFRVVVSL